MVIKTQSFVKWVQGFLERFAGRFQGVPGLKKKKKMADLVIGFMHFLG